MSKTGIIVVAAGESKRLGQPKQLLPFQGTTLLRHAAEVALKAGTGPVAVVLGAVFEECCAALEGVEVRVVRNDSWAEGMGGSIAKGMAALLPEHLDGVIVMPCDQPAVSPEILRRLLNSRIDGAASMAASFYPSGALGPPACFGASRFSRLLALKGNAGARVLFSDGICTRVPFPEGDLDVDEPTHLAWLENYDARLREMNGLKGGE